jgi:hypothetical protein
VYPALAVLQEILDPERGQEEAAEPESLVGSYQDGWLPDSRLSVGESVAWKQNW